jgi:hypothetical protein
MGETGFDVNSHPTQIDSDIGLLNAESSGQEDDTDCEKEIVARIIFRIE